MDKQVIFDFIKQNGGAEVPALQLQFNLSYKQARDIVSELVSSKRLEYYKGVTYVCVGKFAENAPTACADSQQTSRIKSREELDESMQEFLRKAEERRRKRVQQIFQQQQRQQQQQQKAADENLEKEAVAWLKDKMNDNGDFKLIDAKTKSEEELIDAKRGDNQEVIRTKERICNYFKECSEFTFALLKLHAIA